VLIELTGNRTILVVLRCPYLTDAPFRESAKLMGRNSFFILSNFCKNGKFIRSLIQTPAVELRSYGSKRLWESETQFVLCACLSSDN